MTKPPRMLPLYLGGFLGPLGTAVMLPMIPELRESFDASTTAVNWGYAAYILPFSVLLIVSGTIGERYGRRRVLTVTYTVFGAASLICALAPTLEVFLVGRVFQGIANAFVTPLLIAGIAEHTPTERLGRAVGLYSSWQAIGTAAGPLIGGISADISWRYGFGLVALASLALIPFVPPGEPRPETAAPRIRPLLTRRMTFLGLAVMIAAAGPLGASVLVGIKARDELNISGSAAGALLLSGSVVAMFLGPVWGRVLDRLGPRRTAVTAVTIVSLLAGALAWSSTPTQLTLNWLLLGALTPLIVVTFQSMGAVAVPSNRAGGLSLILAYRFLGHGVGPLIFVPMWVVAPTAAFVVSASLGLFAIIGFIVVTHPEPQSSVSAL